MTTRLYGSQLLILLILLTPRTAEAQFVAGPPLNQHDYVDFVGQINAIVASGLNETFDLPREVTLTSGRCGQANAFYVLGDSQIVLCTELIAPLFRQVNQQQPGIGVFSQLMFFVFHEVGHALIDVLDLPVVGQEEDGVDQLAVLLLNDEPVMAMWAADFWRQGANGAPGSLSIDAFVDAHDLNQQRFYNITCWTYGADPLTRGYVVDFARLPPQRTQRCQGEYDRMRSSWERLLRDHLKNPAAFADPPRNATGYWRFMESMSDTDLRARCSASGTLILTQLSEGLSGTMEQQGSCIYFGVPADNNAPATPLSTGRVNESGIVFEIQNCRYEGSFEDESRMALSGSIVCTSNLPDGSILELTGTWHAVR